MNYAERVRQAQRLMILQTLAEDVDYRVNDSMLQSSLDYLGTSLSMDALHDHLFWLETAKLVTLESVQSMKIAKLTTKGLDCVKGRAVVDGVERPRPEDT